MVEVWSKRVEDARERRDKQISHEYRIPQELIPSPKTKDVSRFVVESGLMTEQELAITNASLVELITDISHKKWSAQDVTRAYCKRAAYAQQLVNCLSEMMFDEAIQRAKELDEYYDREGKLFGPLHGVPVSIKDQHNIKGAVISVGYVKWSADVSTFDASLVNLLRDLGAVIYCKTSVPLGMMSSETETRLWGRTTNPKNRDLGVGGSSGGEGALLQFGGSPIGIGSDIGGSIRFPCAFNGLYGLKGTSNRFPIAGTRSGLYGQAHISSIIGPMARDAESLEYFAKIVYNSNPTSYDFNCLPIPWREPQLPEKLSFGVLRYDGICRVTPPVQRALDMTIEAVKKAGHEVIEWEARNVSDMCHYIETFFAADGGKFIVENMDGEPPLENQKWLFEQFDDVPSSVIWGMQRGRAELCKQTVDQWKETSKQTFSGRQIDGIISPSAVVPAHPHQSPTYLGYTSYWNAVDFPCASFPVTQVNQDLDDKPVDFAPISDREKKMWDSYEVQECKDGFVGLQVICPKYEDERAVVLAKLISKTLTQ